VDEIKKNSKQTNNNKKKIRTKFDLKNKMKSNIKKN